MKNTTEISLGIDTGGTYTDAIVFRAGTGVLTKAKSLTTKHDLSIGISSAVGSALAQAKIKPEEIGLVSMSTTLATNALVEGQGGRIGLVLIGFENRDLERAGLGEALGSDPVVFLPGGHTVQGQANELDTAPLYEFLDEFGDTVSGFAVAGIFAVRNPEHEIAVRDILREKTGMAVTCSHELSAKLGGPKRALTTLLNARLVPTNNRLIEATQGFLMQQSIAAPLMVVRGDGSLVSSDFALMRPIETILSGPAASLVGAHYLTGKKKALVSDIGGTTTDVALLEDGKPRLNPDGATVGGFQTMVEAVAMHTFGLGGDSEVHLDEANKNSVVKLGPRRVVPLSLFAVRFPQIVEHLKRQLRDDRINEKSGRFVVNAGLPETFSAGLSKSEQALFGKIGEVPLQLDQVVSRSSEQPILDRLISLGLVLVSAVTPSDAMHLLGKVNIWNAKSAELGLQLFAKRKNRFGETIASDADVLANIIFDQLVLQSANALYATCFAEDGKLTSAEALRLIEQVETYGVGSVKPRLQVDRPVIGLGASAAICYSQIAERLGTEGIVAIDSDVANAIGAVVGNVTIRVTKTVTSQDGGSTFHVLLDGSNQRLQNEQEVLDLATAELKSLARSAAEEAGAQTCDLTVSIHIDAPIIENKRHFVQAEIAVTASGRPQFGDTP